MKDIEIEVQVRVEKDQTLKKFLESEAKFISENRQVDEYFTPAHENFVSVKPIEEWFRLRDENGIFSMNYKKWHYKNGIGDYADEYETVIEDMDTARKLFLALDFKPLVLVDKTRRKYMHGNYEIALDIVVGLGNFVEIEYKGDEAVQPEDEVKRMIEFLKQKDCGTIELNNGGYPMLLLFPQDAHYIKV